MLDNIASFKIFTFNFVYLLNKYGLFVAPRDFGSCL